MKKVTIEKATGTGILTKDADGKWSVEMNGQKMPGNLHYTDDQVASIISKAQAAGEKITVE